MKVEAKVQYSGIVKSKDVFCWAIIIDDKRTNGPGKSTARIDSMIEFESPEKAVDDLNSFLDALGSKLHTVTIQQDEVVKK